MEVSLRSAIFLFFCGASFLSAEQPANLVKRYEASLRQRFPDVATISPQALAELGKDVLLLDVRSPEEHNVSRIAGAVRAEHDAIAQLRRMGIERSRRIVVYCSVGLRSARLVRILVREGFTHVLNLEGGIFRWANEGKALVNNKGPTRVCHPYDVFWGRYLKRQLWSWKPL